ncbi:hypothetical protein L1887_54384 [Cichorium endivia]|nr:hypothetical protein L1887_54384 [Cichorium endivia]
MRTCVGAADEGLGVDVAAAARWLPPFGFRPYRLHQSLVRLDRNSVLLGLARDGLKRTLCVSRSLDLICSSQSRYASTIKLQDPRSFSPHHLPSAYPTCALFIASPDLVSSPPTFNVGPPTPPRRIRKPASIRFRQDVGSTDPSFRQSRQHQVTLARREWLGNVQPQRGCASFSFTHQEALDPASLAGCSSLRSSSRTVSKHKHTSQQDAAASNPKLGPWRHRIGPRLHPARGSSRFIAAHSRPRRGIALLHLKIESSIGPSPQVVSNPAGTTKQMRLVNGRYPGPLVQANIGGPHHRPCAKNGHGQCPHPSTGMVNSSAASNPDGRSRQESQSAALLPAPPSPTIGTVQQSGSYWWHSHYGPTYADGLFGPLILHGDDEKIQDDQPKQHHQHSNQRDHHRRLLY